MTPKTILRLTAAPTPFTADGVTVCHVSVSPFQPCTLLVDGTPYALVPEDHTVELTADSPHVFQISLAPLAALGANPIIVEAR